MTTNSHSVAPELLLTCKRPNGSNGWMKLWRALVDWIAPFGYEDETGFHYGKQPSRLRDQI